MTPDARESPEALVVGSTAADERPRSKSGQRTPQDRAAARLEQIWIKRGKGSVMDAVPTATLEQGKGLRGNANRGGRRQVTIISHERWAALTATLGVTLPPSTRRANLMVSGIDLENARGRVLRVGTVRLKINGETRPCEQMEAAHPGLQAAMQEHWGGGAFAEVLDDGQISIGDDVGWESV
jgi:MOSC domain-containing protein YiiM